MTPEQRMRIAISECSLHVTILNEALNRGTQYLFHVQHHNRALKNITIPETMIHRVRDLLRSIRVFSWDGYNQ